MLVTTVCVVELIGIYIYITNHSPRFMWMWPSGRVSIMGGQQAAFVLSSVARGMDDEQKEKFKEEVVAKYDHNGHPYYSSARLWDDGVIDPADTRKMLGLALTTTMNQPETNDTDFGVFRF